MENMTYISHEIHDIELISMKCIIYDCHALLTISANASKGALYQYTKLPSTRSTTKHACPLSVGEMQQSQAQMF